MRMFLFILCSVVVVGLAFWAYNENYKTQAKLDHIAELRQQISDQREAISVLNAEWAYLNRPDRLRALVDLNFESLELIPLNGDHFGDTRDIQLRPNKQVEVNAPIEVMNTQEVSQ
jgi:hypothetical protein